MKKTHKKLIGGLGLVLVAGMTFVAAQLPSPGASAADGTTSITDTITVRVVEPVADVNFTVPAGNLETVNPAQTIGFTYDNASRVVLSVTYTDNDGNETTVDDFWSADPDYESGDVELAVNLDGDGTNVFGHGTFVWTLKGLDFNGVMTDEDSVEIEYQPVYAEFNPNADGSVGVDLTYLDSTLSKNVVKVYRADKDGNIGDAIYSHDVMSGTHEWTIPATVFDEIGWYYLEVVAYDTTGADIYATGLLYHVTEIANTGAPNTGGLFQNLNISREDYLVTGLIVFFVFAVVAFGVVARGRRGSKSSKRR